MVLHAINYEIRGCEKKTSGYTGRQYLVIKAEDNNGNTAQFVDYNMENEEYYKRGVFADFVIKFVSGKNKNGSAYTSMTIEKFTLVKN